MAYTRKTRVAIVKIQGGDYDGLELQLSLSVSMQDFIDFQKKRFGPASTIETQQEAFKWFGDEVLKSWNHQEPDGTPTPVGYEKGLSTVEPALVLEVMNRWREAITELDVPLVGGSTSGTELPVATTTTESR